MIRLLPLREAQTIAFKEEMQEAFQHGFQSYYKEDNQWQVLPDKDFYQSLVAEDAEAYEAIDTDGQRVGGAPSLPSMPPSIMVNCRFFM